MVAPSRTSETARPGKGRKAGAGPVPPPPLMGSVVTADAPSPLELFWKTRAPLTHVIPYDELTVRKGLRLFDTMLTTDETIAYGWNLKRMVLSQLPWRLVPPTDREGEPLPGAEDVRDHVMEHLERFHGFEETLELMTDALRQGFKLAEIVTKETTIGGRRVWTLADLRVRNSRFYAFDVDDAGQLKPDGILEYTGNDPDGGGVQSYWSKESVRAHPTAKFLRWTWNPLDHNAYSLYGLSDFRAAYRGYFLGDAMLKAWGQTLDTYQHPIPIAVARAGLNATQRQDFLDWIVRAAQRKGAVIPAEYLPDGMEPQKCLWFHEVQGKADDFSTVSEYVDKVKLRATMIGALVSDVGSKGSGSFALGQQHVQMFLTVIQSIGKSRGRAFSRGLFAPLVRWNMGEEAAELAPMLAISDANDDKSKLRSEIVTALISAGVVDPTEPWVREFVGDIPPAPQEILEVQEVEREARKESAKQAPELERKKAEPKNPATLSTGDPPLGKGSGPGADTAHRAVPDEVVQVELKVDADGIEASQDARLERHAESIRWSWEQAFTGPGGLAAQVRVAMKQTVPTLEFRIDGDALERPMRRLAADALVEGAVEALGECDRGLRALGRSGLMSAERLAEGEDIIPRGGVVAALPAAPFGGTIDLATFARSQGVELEPRMADLASRIRLRQSDLDAFAAARTSEIRAEIEAQIARVRGDLRQLVLGAKGEGRSARDLLRGEFKAMEQKWAGMERDMGAPSSALAETVDSSAYNEGRLRLYEATPAGTVIGLLYSAVVDAKTTRFCQQWDGFMAPKSDPVWRRVLPPNHWRCRAIVVAVLAGERSMAELEAAAARTPSDEPAAGFRGVRFMPPVPDRR